MQIILSNCVSGYFFFCMCFLDTRPQVTVYVGCIKCVLPSGDDKDNGPPSSTFPREESEWLKEKLLEEFERQDKVNQQHNQHHHHHHHHHHQSHHSKSRSAKLDFPAKKSTGTTTHHQSKGKDSGGSRHQRRKDRKDGECGHAGNSPPRTGNSSLDFPASDVSRKPSRSSGLADPEEYRGTQTPADKPGKQSSGGYDHRRRGDWSDGGSPVPRDTSEPHLCREFRSNSHSLSSRRGGAGVGDSSPPPRHATMPRERSPSHRHRSSSTKHSTMPRGSSPASSRHRPSNSAVSMPCSPPPYVDPKDKDCGCACDCRSSYFPSQEVTTSIYVCIYIYLFML